jgi:hypothetical protein
LPALIGIRAVHALETFKRIGPKILVVDDPVVADDKGLYCNPILGWRCSQSEPTYHGSLDDEVDLSQRRGRTLPLENIEIVAVIRLRLTRIRVALLKGLGNSLSNRASPAPIRVLRVLPSETIMFPGMLMIR